MTWLECKNAIRDLGFEEDSTMHDYQSIVINAVNRAINIIYYTVVIANYQWFVTVLQDEPDEPNIITAQTNDSEVIALPNNVVQLVPLLASYYVWLDDDTVKATVYKNEYEDYKESLINTMLKPTLKWAKDKGVVL